MATVESPAQAAPLPGLAHTLVMTGKLGQQAAEDLYKKAQQSNKNFIAELTGSGAVSAFDLAHTISAAFAAPLIDAAAIDPNRLPQDLIDRKLIIKYRILPLSKRGNRLIIATADPTDHEAAEKVKFATQMGVEWVIAEYDKLSHLIETATRGTGDGMDGISADDFEFGEDAASSSEAEEDAEQDDSEDTPIVRFLQKMLVDAVSMRASDLHFEPYEFMYRVRFRIDGELREIASPPPGIKEKLASRIKEIGRAHV